MAFGWAYTRTTNRILSVTTTWNLILRPSVLFGVILLCLVQEHHLAGSISTELPRFTMCNSGIDMGAKSIHQVTMCNSGIDMDAEHIDQGVLELVIRDMESTNMRVSCDVRIEAGYDKHVMFYITDLYLGAPNGSYRMDKACIEPRDVNGYHESRLIDMRRSRICSSAEVELRSRVYSTTGSALLIRFYRNRGFSLNAYLKVVFTAFRLGTCRTTERKCQNERCIAHSVVCNDHNPCGDFSDCPTGLEHLSSWAMSGIVILAILAGGIVIIMATVCLQRAGSKSADWDDLSTSMGDGRIENNVELTDVIATTKERRIRSEKNDDPLCGLSRVKPECSPLNTHNGARAKDIRISLDSDKSSSRDDSLLMAADTVPIIYPQTTSNSLLNTFDSFETSERSSETVNTTVSSHTLSPLDAPDNKQQHAPLLPDVTSSFTNHRRNPDAFSLSDNSIVLTDSDSGNERDRVRLANSDIRAKRDRMSAKGVKLTSPPNGAVQHNGAHTAANIHNNHVFSDYKPTPPPYGYVFS